MATQTIREIKNGTGITTDNTTHISLATFDISTGGPGGVALNNCSIFIYGRNVGMDTTNNQVAGEMIAGQFKVVSGTLSKVGSTAQVTAMIDDLPANPGADFSTSGTVITMYVTGVTGRTIQWYGTMDIVVYQPT